MYVNQVVISSPKVVVTDGSEKAKATTVRFLTIALSKSVIVLVGSYILCKFWKGQCH